MQDMKALTKGEEYNEKQEVSGSEEETQKVYFSLLNSKFELALPPLTPVEVSMGGKPSKGMRLAELLTKAVVPQP